MQPPLSPLGILRDLCMLILTNYYICFFVVVQSLLLLLSPRRRQPTRLPHPWDSPGKNTGVGCHFLLQCMKVKRESKVTQLCPTLSNPMNCSPPGSSIHGILQARVLEWVISSSLRPRGLQHARLPCPSLSPGFCSNCVVQWYLQTISSSVAPFSSCPQSSPLAVFFSKLALQIKWPKYWSFSLSISFSWCWINSGLISFRIDWFNLGCPKDSQESSPAPQFESINSLALSLLCGPTLNICTWLLETPSLWQYGPLSAKWYLCF